MLVCPPKKEFSFYKKNRSDLQKKYFNKFLVIQKEDVVGVYSSTEEAYKESLGKGLVLGTFLIQHVGQDDKDTQETCKD